MDLYVETLTLPRSTARVIILLNIVRTTSNINTVKTLTKTSQVTFSWAAIYSNIKG